jgi:hypothetical protein
MQMDDFAFGSRKVVQGFVNLFPSAIIIVHRRDWLGLDERTIRLKPRHFARRSPTNCPQPLWKSLGILERIKPAACSRERLLCGILGQMLIRQSAAGDSHCQAVVTLVQLAKTVDVTRAGRFYKFRVRTLQWGSFSWPEERFASVSLS